MRTWAGRRRPRRTARGSSGWSPRSRWARWGWCWGSRCRGRPGRDWHQLIELCSLSQTLLADADGVYDPNEYNDRLLLGLKGTVSEVELHLIKQRMAAGRLAKAARGELAVPLPAGYVRRPSGEAALDPDEQVQAVVRLTFDLFEQLGTVHGVLGFLVG